MVKFQPGVPVKPMLAKPMTGISEVLLRSRENLLTLSHWRLVTPHTSSYAALLMPHRSFTAQVLVIDLNEYLSCRCWTSSRTSRSRASTSTTASARRSTSWRVRNWNFRELEAYKHAELQG